MTGNLHGTFGADKVCEYIGKDHHGRAERQNLKVLRGVVPRGGIGAEKVQEGVREKERGRRRAGRRKQGLKAYMRRLRIWLFGVFCAERCRNHGAAATADPCAERHLQ